MFSKLYLCLMRLIVFILINKALFKVFKVVWFIDNKIIANFKLCHYL